ncbi:hypothetical protein MKX01_028413 [Papaver californicum]|nr:hypothetical protein MKX01_028413 [Papaver californicum]
MKRKNVKTFSLMVLLMLGLFVGKSCAFSKDCFVGCLVTCDVTHPNKHMLECQFTCLKRCILDGTPSDKIESLGDHYCKLGCATTNCISRFDFDFDFDFQIVNLNCITNLT